MQPLKTKQVRLPDTWLQVRVQKTWKNCLRDAAKERGECLSDFIRKAVEERIAATESKKEAAT